MGILIAINSVVKLGGEGMRGLKFKTVSIILTLVIIASLVTVSLGIFRSFQAMENIVDTQFQSKLEGAFNMLENETKDVFGSLTL